MKQITFTLTGIKENLKRVITDAPETNATELKEFALIQRVKAGNLALEKRRLIAQYGENDPRVNLIQNKLNLYSRVNDTLETQIASHQPQPQPQSQPQPASPTAQTIPEIPLKETQWIVRGKITDDKGTPMPGAIVSLYDKDLIFDDYLGSRMTGKNGNYEFVFTGSGFKNLVDANPDIFLKITDVSGHVIYTSEKYLRCDSGKEELLNIKVKLPGKTAGQSEDINIK